MLRGGRHRAPPEIPEIGIAPTPSKICMKVSVPAGTGRLGIITHTHVDDAVRLVLLGMIYVYVY